jgi:hypothetical protein
MEDKYIQKFKKYKRKYINYKKKGGAVAPMDVEPIVLTPVQALDNIAHPLLGLAAADPNLLPFCTQMSQFTVTQEQIMDFQRYIDSPADCFINAFQILGFIDLNTANLLRIIKGDTGFLNTEIESIFALYLRKNVSYSYYYTDNIDHWYQAIQLNLLPSHACFVGYHPQEGEMGHYFLIVKNEEENLILIDPQMDGGIFCELINNECLGRINRGPGFNYHILSESQGQLNVAQLAQLGFIIPEDAPAPMDLGP